MAESIIKESYSATGLPGTTAGTRYVGATASGAPTTGTFLLGDHIVDQTGAFWVCTIGGTPGSWSKVGGALATVNITGQTAAQSATTLYTTTTSGLYTVNYYAKVTTAATTNSSLGAFTVISTAPDSTISTTVGQTTSQNSTTSGFISGTITVFAASGTAIQYSCGYSSSGATAMQYSLYAAVAGATNSPSTGTVSSFNGRTGAVTPGSSDYLAVPTGGLTGATAATRYVGGTTSGAPTTGTFAVGDYVVDQTGAMYVCTVAGTPGTWQLSGVSVNENIAGKNFVINGGMDIWQRGTTVAINNGFAYGADRWNVYSTYSNVTMYRQTTSDLTNVPSIQYAGQVQRTVSNTFTTTIYLSQSIETANTIPLAGKTVNMSFYAKCGSSYNQSGTGPLAVQFVTGTGTDQNVINGFTGANAIINTTVTITSAWQKFTVAVNSGLTATVPTSATESAVIFNYTPTGTAGANDWFQVTGVQLEIAPQATPFSRAGGSIGGELALCMRYYERRTAAGANFGIGIPVSLRSSISAYGAVTYGAPKRVNPTIDFSNIYVQFGNTTNCTPTGMAGVYGAGSAAGYPSAGFDITLSGSGVANAAGWLIDSGGGAGYIAFLAEL